MRNKKCAYQRFYDFIKSGPIAGCWEWSGALNRSGYGLFCISGTKGMHASRASWILHKGPIPEGMCVCHSCDNPGCVNPDHLWLGTKADNNRDRSTKNRSRPSKLTAEDVEFITRNWSKYNRNGWTQKKLSDKFGVSRGMISYITSGKPPQKLKPVRC